MSQLTCIQIWPRDQVPSELSEFRTYADDGEIENTVFVAHVPATVLQDRLYRLANGETGLDSWIYPGDLGLLGVNAIDKLPHPNGDGIIVIGSCI